MFIKRKPLFSTYFFSAKKARFLTRALHPANVRKLPFLVIQKKSYFVFNEQVGFFFNFGAGISCKGFFPKVSGFEYSTSWILGKCLFSDVLSIFRK
jgi:hypothetical protein